MPTTIIINHNAGFFSCCSVKLNAITNYINWNRMLPHGVDSSAQFEWYKAPNEGDVTYKYFEHPDNIPLNITCYEVPYHHSYQFINYNRLRYDLILPIVKKYFTPSAEIYAMIDAIEKKYHLDYNHLCVVFYRGNDKITETALGDYSDYLAQARSILEKNPEMRFLIQSDETEFIEFMEKELPNSVVFYDEIRHMTKRVSTVDVEMKDNIELFSKYYLAITVVMSKCKYIVCGSGNCSIWIMFYRGNCKGVHQYLKGYWVINQI